MPLVIRSAETVWSSAIWQTALYPAHAAIGIRSLGTRAIVGSRNRASIDPISLVYAVIIDMTPKTTDRISPSGRPIMTAAMIAGICKMVIERLPKWIKPKPDAERIISSTTRASVKAIRLLCITYHFRIPVGPGDCFLSILIKTFLQNLLQFPGKCALEQLLLGLQ